MSIKQTKPSSGYGYIIHGDGGDYLVELKQGLASTRDLRAVMLSMAMTLNTGDNQAIFILVLLQPEMALGTVYDEWSKFYHAVSQNLRKQLELLVYDETGFNRVAPSANDYETARLPMSELIKIINRVSKPVKGKGELPQPDLFHIVTTILIKNLVRENKFLQTKELQELACCSYPSVQRVLHKLEPWLERDSSRSLRLRHFPTDVWWKLLSHADNARHTLYFKDVSGQPRSIENMLKRFCKLNLPNMAVGGVTGSLSHFPKLDIVGSPRLDLNVHQPSKQKRVRRTSLSPTLILSPEEIASKIDPGLEETTNPNDPIQLAIHYIRHKPCYFTYDEDLDMQIADEVECLFDLHGARLTPQAEQFLNHLKHKTS